MSLLTIFEERQSPGPDEVARDWAGRRADGRVDATSTRGLMVTVLGEFVLPHGGAAWTQTLIDAMGELDVSEKATRQVLVRLEDRGWLRRTKSGRRTRWHLTDQSSTLLETGADRIYRHATAVPVWDGRWSVLLASVADGDDADRHRLTAGLGWAGFGSLGQGTWICPWVERESEAVRVVLGAGISQPTSFVAELGALGDERELAGRAWDLDRLAGEYREFLDDVSSRSDASAIASTIAAVHRWRRFPALDPQLPTELLPGRWPAAEAAVAFAAARDSAQAAATDWWLDREARYGSH